MYRARMNGNRQPATDVAGDLTLLCETIVSGFCPHCGEQSIVFIELPETPTVICIECDECDWALAEPEAAPREELQSITQANLLEFHQLSQLARRREFLRRQLSAAIEAGVAIEAGPLVPDMTLYTSQRATWHAIRDYLGQETVELLRGKISLSTQRTLRVRPKFDGVPQSRHSPPRNVFDPIGRGFQ